MLKEGVIHYPKDEAALNKIRKQITDFKSAAVASYIQSLKLSEVGVEELFAALERKA